MKKKISIAIVGCGRVFNHYVKIFKKRKEKDYRIIVVCDEDKKKAKIASKIFICKKI